MFLKKEEGATVIISHRGSQWCSSAACSPLWWSERGDCRCRSRWCIHVPRCPGSPGVSSSPQCCWPEGGRGGSWAGLVREILEGEISLIKAKTQNHLILILIKQVLFFCFYRPGRSQRSPRWSSRWPGPCHSPSLQTPGKSTPSHAPDLEETQTGQIQRHRCLNKSTQNQTDWN